MSRKKDNRILEQVVIRLTQKQLQQLREKSQKIEISISAQVRQAVEEYLINKNIVY